MGLITPCERKSVEPMAAITALSPRAPQQLAEEVASELRLVYELNA
jgi:hypothetical protein